MSYNYGAAHTFNSDAGTYTHKFCLSDFLYTSLSPLLAIVLSNPTLRLYGRANLLAIGEFVVGTYET